MVHLTRTMPPLINRYPRRYHPFSRPLALHSSFPAERHACPLHSLYNIYPTDSDVTAIDRPEPLTHKPVLMTAADYFAVLEVQKPSTPFPKPDGEPGRKPGKSHKGYVLADVLAWPMEVYKEVQVNRFLSLLLVLMLWNSRSSINLPRKIYLLLLLRNKRQTTLRLFTRRYIHYFQF
jgi:hypothetical protein